MAEIRTMNLEEWVKDFNKDNQESRYKLCLDENGILKIIDMDKDCVLGESSNGRE